MYALVAVSIIVAGGVGSFFSPVEEDPGAYLEAAKTAVADRRFRSARRNLEKARRLAPPDWPRTEELEYYEAEYDSAARAFANRRLREVRVWYSQGEYAEAGSACRQVLEVVTDEREPARQNCDSLLRQIDLRLAEKHLIQGRHGAAARVLQERLATDRDDHEIWALLTVAVNSGNESTNALLTRARNEESAGNKRLAVWQCHLVLDRPHVPADDRQWCTDVVVRYSSDRESPVYDRSRRRPRR